MRNFEGNIRKKTDWRFVKLSSFVVSRPLSLLVSVQALPWQLNWVLPAWAKVCLCITSSSESLNLSGLNKTWSLTFAGWKTCCLREEEKWKEYVREIVRTGFKRPHWDIGEIVLIGGYTNTELLALCNPLQISTVHYTAHCTWIQYNKHWLRSDFYHIFKWVCMKLLEYRMSYSFLVDLILLDLSVPDFITQRLWLCFV